MEHRYVPFRCDSCSNPNPADQRSVGVPTHRIPIHDRYRNTRPTHRPLTKVSFKQKLWCGAWLTACTYPIVVLVLPAIFLGQSRALYLTVAETFAPVGECLLFWLAFRGKGILEATDWVRCFIAIIIANLASFAGGEVLNDYDWFGLF